MILRSLELNNYVINDPPKQKLNDGYSNLEFKSWHKQDEMLGCWLLLCMADETLKQILGFDTSKDAWTKLEKSYASCS